MGLFNIKELIDEIKDGVSLQIEAEANAVERSFKILSGEPGVIPFKVVVKIEE